MERPVRSTVIVTDARATSPAAPVATTSAVRVPDVDAFAVTVNGQFVPGAMVAPMHPKGWIVKSFVGAAKPRAVIRAGPVPLLRIESAAGANASRAIVDPKSKDPGSMVI